MLNYVEEAPSNTEISCREAVLLLPIYLWLHVFPLLFHAFDVIDLLFRPWTALAAALLALLVFLSFPAPLAGQSRFAPVDLTSHFNNDAAGTRDHADDGNFDAIGDLAEATFNYAADHLPDTTTSPLLFGGVPFRLGDFRTPGAENNIALRGQTIELPETSENNGGWSHLFVIGSSVNGSYRTTATLTYADGSTSTALLSLSDWCGNPVFGESVAVRSPERYLIAGHSSEPSPNALFVQTLRADRTRQLKSLTLAPSKSLHVFAVTLGRVPDNFQLPPGEQVLAAGKEKPRPEIVGPGVVAAGERATFRLDLPEELQGSVVAPVWSVAAPGQIERSSESEAIPLRHFDCETSLPGLITVALADGAFNRPGSGSLVGQMLTTRSTVAVLPTVSEDRQTSSFYGMNAPLVTNAGEPNTALVRMMRIAGVGSVRIEFDWQGIEPRPGEWKFAHFDQEVKTATAHGIEPYGLLAYWAGWSDAYTDEGYRQYANYVRTVVGRYKNQVKRWEIWNEPNIFYWKRGAKEYVQLLREGYKAAKQADPECEVYAMCTAHLPLDWIEEAFRHGANEYLDGVSVHPYRPEGKYPEETDFLGDMERLRAVMTRYGAGNKPVALSEMGHSTLNDGEGHNVTEKELANSIVRSHVCALGVPGIEMILWYRFDDPGFEQWNEHHFGIVEPRLNPKLAYVAYATMTRLLPAPRFRRWVVRGPEIWAAELEGENKGSIVSVLWSTRDPRRVQVEFPGTGTWTDLSGRESVAKAGVLELTDAPVFLRTEAPLRVTETTGTATVMLHNGPDHQCPRCETDGNLPPWRRRLMGRVSPQYKPATDPAQAAQPIAF